MNVWVIMGVTGEYSDHREWAMCAYESETKAEVYAQHLNEELTKRKLHYDTHLLIDDDKKKSIVRAWRERYDRKFCIDYTGSEYRVIGPIEVRK